MGDKTLKDKAIDIRGKEYVLVSDRVIYFNNTYPKGFIQTKLVSEPSDQLVVVKAKVTPDYTQPSRYFTGYSQAKWGEGMVNKTAALENAETSSVGRALAMMGIGVIDSIASADEMRKTNPPPAGLSRDQKYHKIPRGLRKEDDPIMQVTKGMGNDRPASDAQRKMIFAVAKQKGLDTEQAKETIKEFFNIEHFDELTLSQAKKAIDSLLKRQDTNVDQIQA